jgi:hypothetical protein
VVLDDTLPVESAAEDRLSISGTTCHDITAIEKKGASAITFGNDCKSTEVTK